MVLAAQVKHFLVFWVKGQRKGCTLGCTMYESSSGYMRSFFMPAPGGAPQLLRDASPKKIIPLEVKSLVRKHGTAHATQVKVNARIMSATSVSACVYMPQEVPRGPGTVKHNHDAQTRNAACPPRFEAGAG